MISRLPRAVLVLCCLALAATACGESALPTPTPTSTPTPTVAPTLPPVVAVPLRFPQDDAPHSNYNTEWWYYNGHLETAAGQRFAFHYVVFQVSIPGLGSGNVIQAALTDVAGQRYLTSQRLTTLQTQPGPQGFSFNIAGTTLQGNNGRDALTFTAGSYTAALQLTATKPPALHDSDGLLDFGPYGSTYYYSRTRMSITGTLTEAGQSQPVSGLAWFDHQWGNFQPQAIGWDWFALQLDDGSDLMLYLIRKPDGSPLAIAGTYVARDGTQSTLGKSEISVAKTAATWRSPVTGITYPSSWTVKLPSRNLDLQLSAVVPNAEFDARSTTTNTYWEGAVAVTGSIPGRGFVELVGYKP